MDNLKNQLSQHIWDVTFIGHSNTLELQWFAPLREDVLSQVVKIFSTISGGEHLVFWSLEKWAKQQEIPTFQENLPTDWNNSIISWNRAYGYSYFSLSKKNGINQIKTIPMVHGIDLHPVEKVFFSIMKNGFMSQEAFLIDHFCMWYSNVFLCVNGVEKLFENSQFTSMSQQKEFVWDWYNIVAFRGDMPREITPRLIDYEVSLWTLVEAIPEDIVGIVKICPEIDKDTANERISLYNNALPNATIIYLYKKKLRLHIGNTNIWYAWILKTLIDEYLLKYPEK